MTWVQAASIQQTLKQHPQTTSFGGPPWRPASKKQNWGERPDGKNASSGDSRKLHSAPSSIQASMFTCSNCSRSCLSRIGLYSHSRYIATLPWTNAQHNYHSLLRLMDANNNNLAFSYYFICDRIMCVLVTFYQYRHFVKLVIRNLNLISIQSWTYLQTSTKRYVVIQILEEPHTSSYSI